MAMTSGRIHETAGQAAGASAAGEATSEADDRAAAFRQLTDERLDASFRIASAILGNHADAQDAVHDAVVAAWQKYDGLRDRAKFDAWFRRIVVNAARAKLRARRRRPTAGLDEGTHLASPDASPAIGERLHLEEALARLDPDDQVVLALRYNHDLKLADIAAALGVPSGTVKSRLNRAHGRLRALLTEDEAQPR